MKSILMITTIPGTLCAFLLPFAKHFRAQGWQVDAMACGISDNLECLQIFDRTWDIEWSRNPLALKNLIVAPRIIKNAIAQRQYDIVHVHTPVAAFVTRYALRDYRNQPKPQVIYTAHGFPFHPNGSLLRNAAFLTLEKLAGSWTDYLVVINRSDETIAKQHHLVASGSLRYMPGIGVDSSYYNHELISHTAIKQVRHELDLAPDTKLFLSIAEFIPRKRPQDILTAFAQLARPDVCLAFAGEGRLLELMQQLALNLGISKQVRFLGHRSDIPALIKASSALVLASEYEGLPRCVMEAMCLDTPVIGTATRGIQDLLKEDYGLLVPVGSPEQLAQAMAWMLDHPEEARMMGKRGRERIADYDLKHIIKLHENLYAEALGRKTAYALK